MSVIASLGRDGPAGCTANAVTSLSLDPLELLVCFDRRSDTLAIVRDTGRFSINVLSLDQADISARFARSCAAGEKFEGVEHRLEEGVPVIDGCVATLVCAVDRMLAGGDHEIVIGRPLACRFDPDREPLIFLRNGYHRRGSLPNR